MITPLLFKYRKFNFPVGEKHIQITDVENAKVAILMEFEQNEDLIELLLVADALKRKKIIIEELVIPYMPFSRQDRLSLPGEALSIKVAADLINMVGAELVTITDPHSDVTKALINNVNVISQDEIFAPILNELGRLYLISPDAGAEKKIFKLATRLTLPPVEVIQCAKIRDVKTGQITDTKVGYQDMNGLFDASPCVIVDDICDGGATFIKLGEKLKALGAQTVVLCVTHGFFTKGMTVFKGSIDRIFTRKGEVNLVTGKTV